MHNQKGLFFMWVCLMRHVRLCGCNVHVSAKRLLSACIVPDVRRNRMSNILSGDALLRIAAYYSLDSDELTAVAAGRIELDDAATQRLAQLRAAATQAAPAPQHEQATGAAAAPARARSKSKRGKPKKPSAKPAGVAVVLVCDTLWSSIPRPADRRCSA